MNWLKLLVPGLMLAAAIDGAAGATLRTAAQTEAEPKFVAADYYGEPVIDGLCIDILRAIEKTDDALRFSGDQQWVPSARIEAQLEAGVLDVACGMVRTAQRQHHQQLLEPALFTLNYLLLARADDKVDVSGWQDIIRLGGDNVVLAMHGTGPSRNLATIPALRVDAGSTSVEQNLRKLMIGRGRFFYYRMPAANPAIRALCAQRQIRVLPATMQEAPAYMMVGRHVPAAIAARLGDALRQLQHSGELARLSRKWQVSSANPSFCLS